MEMSGSLRLPPLLRALALARRRVLDPVPRRLPALAPVLPLLLDRVPLPALGPARDLPPPPEMERSFSTTPRRFKQRTVY